MNSRKNVNFGSKVWSPPKCFIVYDVGHTGVPVRSSPGVLDR